MREDVVTSSLSMHCISATVIATSTAHYTLPSVRVSSSEHLVVRWTDSFPCAHAAWGKDLGPARVRDKEQRNRIMIGNARGIFGTLVRG